MVSKTPSKRMKMIEMWYGWVSCRKNMVEIMIWKRNVPRPQIRGSGNMFCEYFTGFGPNR